MIHFCCFTRTAPGSPRGLDCSSVALGPTVPSVCCLTFHQSVPMLWLLLLQKSWAYGWDRHLICFVRKPGGRREDGFLWSPLLKGKIWIWANLRWESCTQTLLQLSKAVHMHWNRAISWLLITIKKQPEVPVSPLDFSICRAPGYLDTKLPLKRNKLCIQIPGLTYHWSGDMRSLA